MLADGSQLTDWIGRLDALLSTGVSDATPTPSWRRIDAEVAALYADVEAPTRSRSRSPAAARRCAEHPTTAPASCLVVRPSSPKLRFPEGDVPVVLGPDRATEV